MARSFSKIDGSGMLFGDYDGTVMIAAPEDPALGAHADHDGDIKMQSGITVLDTLSVDADKSPWREASLVTPHHGVWIDGINGGVAALQTWGGLFLLVGQKISSRATHPQARKQRFAIYNRV